MRDEPDRVSGDWRTIAKTLMPRQSRRAIQADVKYALTRVREMRLVPAAPGGFGRQHRRHRKSKRTNRRAG